MAGNTSTSKKGADFKDSPQASLPSKGANYRPRGPKYEGQVAGDKQSFAEPMNDVTAKIGGGLEHLHNDIGEMSGFITDGYLDKGGTPYGEAAKFNFLPPGMDISNQENAEIHEMKLYKITAESYPNDGWMPSPKDIKE